MIAFFVRHSLSIARFAWVSALLYTMPVGVSAQANDSVPVLQYEAPRNFVRVGIPPMDDFSAMEFNGSIQVYPFEPFSGNVADAFQRTLLRDRIDMRYREENVAGQPQFGRGQMAGAQGTLYASFAENRVGLMRPHARVVIVAGGQVAVVDASSNTAASWQKLQAELINFLNGMRVASAAAPPSLSEGPGPAGRAMAGLYRGEKSKYMTGLTFQRAYQTMALHFYLFSANGRVYRAYDQILPPGVDVSRFDFDLAQRNDPANSGRYAIKNGQLFIKFGSGAAIVTPAPQGNTVRIESVVYVRER